MIHGNAFKLDHALRWWQDFASEIFHKRDSGLLSSINVLDEAIDVVVVNAVQNVFDWLIHLSGVSHSHRALQDTHSSNILINDSFQVFGLPKGVLLEPELKVIVQSWHEGDGLLSS